MAAWPWRPAARCALGSQDAESWCPARCRASAVHTEEGASLICQLKLETSAFPPSALETTRGEGSGSGLRRRRTAQTPTSQPGTLQRRPGRVWTPRAQLPSGSSLRIRSRAGTCRLTRRDHGAQAGNSICPERPGNRQTGRGEGARAFRQPRKVGEVGKPTLAFFSPSSGERLTTVPGRETAEFQN